MDKDILTSKGCSWVFKNNYRECLPLNFNSLWQNHANHCFKCW